MKDFNYTRRKTREVNIGGTPLGADNPVRVQSMTSTSTMDTKASVAQIKRIVDAGGEYVRLTAQGVREAENLGKISEKLREEGVNVPLVADIHFNPRAAFAAATRVEKVRINPGNFVDPGRVFKKIEFTDEEYASELQRIEDALVPFLDLCRQNSTAIRIGVNHGSLSDRIMSRYGDTPAGMVESAMEFLRVCSRHDFNDVVISIKASNVAIMVETVRRMVAALEAEGMDYPLHLGVTEAGDGEDGRVKSAVGIGTLLSEGLGDTIRVSLSEDPEREIPVARMIVDYVAGFSEGSDIKGMMWDGFDPLRPERRRSVWVGRPPVVVGSDLDESELDDAIWIDASEPVERYADEMQADFSRPVVLSSRHRFPAGEMQAFLHSMMRLQLLNPVILKADYSSLSPDEVTVRAAVDLGTLVMNGFSDGIWIQSDALDGEAAVRLGLGILQAARLRMTKTEYISCPGCGRTLYDLQSTLHDIKAATSHLKGLKIGVMGCIVNGPGEMADADYGYVGAGVGRVSLYKGKECIEKNIPTSEAIPRLIALIKDGGDWTEPDNNEN